jgi:hypothetical protein
VIKFAADKSGGLTLKLVWIFLGGLVLLAGFSVINAGVLVSIPALQHRPHLAKEMSFVLALVLAAAIGICGYWIVSATFDAPPTHAVSRFGSRRCQSRASGIRLYISEAWRSIAT